jgi:hypothetical protein
VIKPWLFRPPCRFKRINKDFSGFAPGVNSAKSLTDEFRRPGEVGLYIRIPISTHSLTTSKTSQPNYRQTQPTQVNKPTSKAA